jgi:hypothetical protein
LLPFRILGFALSAACAPAPSLLASGVHHHKTAASYTRPRLKAVVDACETALPLGDRRFASHDAYLFAWGLFLSVNCPVEGRQPPVRTWETWKPNYAVYLPGGKTPAPWTAPLPPRVLLDQPEIDGSTLLDKNGQPVLNEIRMNKPSFEYIVQRNLYSRAGQLAFFADLASPPVDFPTTALEIKAAWLILTPGDPRNSRYYTIDSTYVDQNGQSHAVLAGLAGLHITSKLLPNWFWTTFEQVDNQAMTQAPEAVPIPPDVRQFNEAMHIALPAGSVWRFYNMRGVQADFARPPKILSNTLLETRFQESSSCITCHDLATRGSASQGRLAFFRAGPHGVQGYVGDLGDPANKYFDAFDKPVCYDRGRNAFTDCKTPNPTIVYKTMDFVWSLREAQ